MGRTGRRGGNRSRRGVPAVRRSSRSPVKKDLIERSLLLFDANRFSSFPSDDKSSKVSSK